jgi:glycosyltransferase involved in cell wall biosynthesis
MTMAAPNKKDFRVLVVAPERFAERSAGPNIRALEFARHLAAEFETTLAVPEGSETVALEGAPFQVRPWTRKDIPLWLDDYSVVISQGTQYPARCCAAKRGGQPLHVFDLYNPFLFEHLASEPNKVPAWEFHAIRRLTRFLFERGDFFLCASPQQRDLWLGTLYATRRLEEAWGGGLGRNRAIDSLVAVVPFGHPGGRPKSSHPEGVFKGHRPGVDSDDEMLLWGGGVWNWFDPMTLLEAMAILAKKRPTAKLLFLASRHPDDAFAHNDMARATAEAAREMGLLDQNVFFNEGWTPLRERSDFLLEADLAVCSAPDTAENHFSYRTRLVDAIWAGLPIVCTEGGFLAEYVESRAIGLVAPAGDPKELAAMIVRALEPEARESFRESLAACRDELRWDRCVEPLMDFCRRAAAGELPRDASLEPAWRPWAQYIRYKAPTMLEMWAAKLRASRNGRNGKSAAPEASRKKPAETSTDER